MALVSKAQLSDKHSHISLYYWLYLVDIFEKESDDSNATCLYTYLLNAEYSV